MTFLPRFLNRPSLVRFPLLLAMLASIPVAMWSQTPAESTFFSTAAEESYSTVQMTAGDGDLWPTCWADDDNLYTANGDGTAFYKPNASRDMIISRISGPVNQLVGTSLARGVGTNYSGKGYNRKPTGMLCVHSTVYLAYQNLGNGFNSAPAASIAKSTDYGSTWTWNATTPMFGGAGNAPLFTTIFFLDYGKNSINATDGYVYAYGLDNNWRDQQALYLARVLPDSVQTRSAWQFYTGTDANGVASWTADITKKQAVLVDTRLLYPTMFGTDCPPQDKVIAQGGVVYDKPLGRYLFSSWSCSTHELYESPAPWGPWKHFLSKDFGPLKGTNNRGQYGTSIPSKFISADGKTLMLQSNVCCSGDSYRFSLRKLYLELPQATSATNVASNANLAVAPGTRAVSKSTHFGTLCGANCTDQISSGPLNGSEDDFDEESKTADWWGYMWPQPYTFDEVVYQTGNVYSDGGWFASGLQVQVFQNGAWVPVQGNVNVSPAYPYTNGAGAQATYTFDFPATSASGVRIAGTPGGASYFSSIGQLGVYYGGRNLLVNPGFEAQASAAVTSPWVAEGPDTHSVDVGGGTAHNGSNDGLIRSSSTSWNALTQTVSVKANTTYTLTAWVQNTFTTGKGAMGVRAPDGVTVLGQSAVAAGTGYVPVTATFNSGANTSVTVYAGFVGQGSDVMMRVDDLALR